MTLFQYRVDFSFYIIIGVWIKREIFLRSVSFRLFFYVPKFMLYVDMKTVIVEFIGHIYSFKLIFK